MKKRMRGAKGLLILFLVAVLVVAGVLASHPVTSQAAAKGTIYNVEILNTATSSDVTKPKENVESPLVQLQSINKGAVGDPLVLPYDGITFQMVLGTKLMTEKLKTGKATYYPVTIIAKTFKAPAEEYQFIQDPDTYDLKVVTTMVKDAIGKLYTSGGDVDVSTVQASSPKVKIGDGTVDPAGSMVIPIILTRIHTLPSRNMNINKDVKATATWTTGQSTCIVKGSKSGLEGKALPKDDSSGLLPNPLVGVPLDLAAGTGTLVSTDVSYKVANALGLVDFLRGGIWVMKITPTSK